MPDVKAETSNSNANDNNNNNAVNIKPESSLKKTSTSSNTDKKSEEKTEKHGFEGLGFASFTTKKFPLIAKAFCESQSISKKELSRPAFKCKQCDQTFPVEGARDLHEASHLPEEYTTCPKCNIHFSDSLRLQEHMQKHVSDVKFEEYLAKEECEEEVMPQNYFLAQFGLMAKDPPIEISSKQSSQGEDNKSVDDEDSGLSDNDDFDLKIDTSKDEEGDTSKEKDEKEDDQEDDVSSGSKLRLTNFFLPASRAVRQEAKMSSPSVSSTPSPSPGKQQLSEVQLKTSTLAPRSSLAEALAHAGRFDAVLGGARERVHPPSFQCKHCNAILASPKDLEGES